MRKAFGDETARGTLLVADVADVAPVQLGEQLDATRQRGQAPRGGPAADGLAVRPVEDTGHGDEREE
ncbi:hypothetical protein [Streptomyces sp. NBC_01431]|uniref:hypothetical protein n=1 Tax=Streptomyces sp. NBC_01431 TaxID=2903863 RepID=UPI002E33C0CC|nr:hypothetical protein [Streptomyces sp. NBC_01431]